MKNLKLVEIFKEGHIVIPIYLLKRYKELNISFEEFIFLMYLCGRGNNTFDPNSFKEELNTDIGKIMEYISNLSDKNYIKVEVNKNDKGLMEEVVSVEGFYNKLSLLLIDDNNKKDVSGGIFEEIEKEFGRTLSPIEYEIIKTWLENNIEEELISEAIKEAVFNGVSNLRYIDKILYEWGKKGYKTREDIIKAKSNKSKKTGDKDIDLDIVDWNWFDDE